MIRKAVIPSAGLGTRLLPATKEQPKEMLPVFTRDLHGNLRLKPLLHIVFENLYNAGFREFHFITGRGKRSIEDYFSIDNNLVRYLKSRNNFESIGELDAFYEKVHRSNIIFINQPEPRGFGDAVYRAKSSTGTEAFLVHAGDDLIISEKNQYLLKLIRVFEKNNAAAAFCVEKVRDARKYGVIVGKKVANNVYRVRKVLEKPPVPPSNIAIVAVYVFSPKIYHAIEEVPLDASNEVQLTNAIEQLINQDCPVYAVELDSVEKRIDIGTPWSYLRALKTTARCAIA